MCGCCGLWVCVECVCVVVTCTLTVWLGVLRGCVCAVGVYKVYVCCFLVIFLCVCVSLHVRVPVKKVLKKK